MKTILEFNAVVTGRHFTHSYENMEDAMKDFLRLRSMEVYTDFFIRFDVNGKDEIIDLN